MIWHVRWLRRKEKQTGKFILILGPCVIESEECVMRIAETVKCIADRLELDYYFKASFDKANRTSPTISCVLGSSEIRNFGVAFKWEKLVVGV